MSNENKIVFHSFKDASLYAKQTALNTGKSVDLKRDGNNWAVIFTSTNVTNTSTNNPILMNEESGHNNKSKNKINIARHTNKPNVINGKFQSQIQIGCNKKNLSAEITVTHEGKKYTWNGKCWYGSDFIKPTTVIIAELNNLAKNEFAAYDASISDSDELLDVARRLREGGQYSRALKLAQRALKINPNNDRVAVIVCSILRLMNRSDEALKLADTFVRRGSTYLPLLTSRAAALCDLNRWSEALRQIRQVLAKSHGKHVGEAQLVWSRIKSYAPKLF